jgi:hypothetical protein
MWEPRRLTTLWASTARYRDSFTFFFRLFNIRRVTKQAEQFAAEELCLEHTAAAEKPSVEGNSEGS